MRILAIETSAAACSLAVCTDQKIFSLHEVIPMEQSRQILSLIDKLLSEAGIALSQLEAIAVGQGPGSFTGIRVAVSVAQGLAFSLSLPVVGLSSLAILAQGAYLQHGWKKIAVAIDAGMGEIYWAAFHVSVKGRLTTVVEDVLCLPEQVVVLEGEDWFGVGNAWADGRIPMAPCQVDANSIPNASAMMALADYLITEGKFCDASAILPVYLRTDVVKKP